VAIKYPFIELTDINLLFPFVVVVCRRHLSRIPGRILSRWPHMSLPGLQFTPWKYFEI